MSGLLIFLGIVGIFVFSALFYKKYTVKRGIGLIISIGILLIGIFMLQTQSTIPVTPEKPYEKPSTSISDKESTQLTRETEPVSTSDTVIAEAVQDTESKKREPPIHKISVYKIDRSIAKTAIGVAYKVWLYNPTDSFFVGRAHAMIFNSKGIPEDGGYLRFVIPPKQKDWDVLWVYNPGPGRVFKVLKIEGDFYPKDEFNADTIIRIKFDIRPTKTKCKTIPGTKVLIYVWNPTDQPIHGIIEIWGLDQYWTHIIETKRVAVCADPHSISPEIWSCWELLPHICHFTVRWIEYKTWAQNP